MKCRGGDLLSFGFDDALAIAALLNEATAIAKNGGKEEKWRESRCCMLFGFKPIAKNGNRTRVSIAPTGIERVSISNQLQRYFVLSRQSSPQEYLDGIGQITDRCTVPPSPILST